MNFAASILNAVFSLIFVIGLILLTAWVFRWWQNNRVGIMAKAKISAPRAARLAVVETLALDFKRKLILIRRDDVLHLLLCGDGQDIVIETQIPLENHAHAAAITDDPSNNKN